MGYFRKELQFYHQVKNEKQQQTLCMTLTKVNELAVSSHKDINIYSFDVTSKSFNVIKTLKGHFKWVCDIKILDTSKDLLLSCSHDNSCKLWNISQENCLKTFNGHSDEVYYSNII